MLVVGGAPGTQRRTALAARSALRAGAGVVFAAVAPEIRDQVAIGCPELMVHGTRDPDEVLELAARADAVVLGPGLGRDEPATALVDALVAGVAASLMLDADALYALRGRLATLAARSAPTALTPHAGEARAPARRSSADVVSASGSRASSGASGGRAAPCS